MEWDPFPAVTCLIGIGLMLTAGRLRRRSLERRTEDVIRRNEVLRRATPSGPLSKRRMGNVVRLRKASRPGPGAAASASRSNVRALPRR
jgi:hypothetical protein